MGGLSAKSFYCLVCRATAGRAFEWQPSAHRTRLEAEHRHQRTRHVCLPFEAPPPRTAENECVFTGSTCVLQGGWELPDEAAAAPHANELAFTVLSCASAVVPLECAEVQ